MNFLDSDFWPVVGAGMTLEKFNLPGFSDDPIHWMASAAANGTPGTVPEGLTYDIWAAMNFTPAELEQPGRTGAQDDFNGDGLPNLYAYAFSYDPHFSPNANLLPKGIVVDDGGEDYFAISFRRQLTATDLTYAAEVSTDLSTWLAADTQVGGADDNSDGTETVVFRSDTAMAGADRQFKRVRVTKTDP